VSDPIERTTRRLQHGASPSRTTTTRTEITRADDVQPIAEQSISAGADSVVTNNNQSINLDLADRNFYFDLQVFSKNEESDEESAETVMFLEAGGRYRLHVTVGLNEYNPPIGTADISRRVQYPVKIGRTLALFLDTHSSIKAITSSQAELLDVRTYHEWNCDFVLEIDAANPSGDITLLLLYSESDPIATLNQALSLVLPVKGNLSSPPVPIKHILPLELEPPPDTVFLYVNAAIENEFELIGWESKQSDCPTTLNPINILSPIIFHETTSEDDYIRTLQNQVHDLSVNNAGNISIWAGDILQRYEKSCCIVVIDQADSGIPWEMLHLSEGRYLGAEARVVRWVEAQYRGGALAMQFQHDQLDGRVVACVPPIHTETDFLEAIAAELAETPEDLQDYLFPDETREPVGFVYMTLNGLLLYGDEHDAIDTLLQRYSEQYQVRFNDIEGLLQLRPFFLVSTPFSGRIFRHGRYSCGLVKAALTQVASGYIGTLGPVDREYAFWFARKLFEAAQSPEGANPAEVLRILRAEAAEEVRKPSITPRQRQAARRRLRYLSLYVYYGNPNIRLRLSARGEAR
jgi:hypothetical protein